MLGRWFSVADRAIGWLDRLQSVLTLLIRLYVANVFFKSGLVKIGNWEGTLALFEYEYAVPLVSPQLAAVAGTAGELVLPVLLALGLAGRFGAAGLSVLNVVAVISYYEPLGEIGRQNHFYWGLLLLVPLVFGPGKLSLDALLWHRLKTAAHAAAGRPE